MNSIPFLVVDDELLARQRIIQSLSNWNPCLTIYEAPNGVIALEKMAEIKTGIVLLDIEMPALSGLDVIRQIDTSRFCIVFQTAYDEYALKAFEHSACDYILKPYSDERLKMAVERAIQRWQFLTNPPPLTEKSEIKPEDRLNGQLAKDGHFMANILIRAGAKSKLVKVDDIHYFSSEEHSTYCNLNNVRYALDVSLNHLEMQLDPIVFMRIHRNCLVNWKFVSGFEGGANPQLILQSGVQLKIARDRLKAAKSRLAIQ
ncbi:MAG: LytR/AlgR family response regulator transcription factor [Pseudobdellovibrionaceae bacterium]